MPVTRVLALQWEQQIANAIGGRDIQADTTFGPVRAIIAYPVSQVADRQNQDLVTLSDLLSLTNVSQFSTQDLDDIAYNSQIIRGPGTASTAVVSLISSSPPTSDVTIPINFPFSTDPDPQTGAVVFFASTQQVTYIAANANNFYDAVNRVYRLDVPVAAVTAGAVGSIGPNRITNAQRAIGGFQRVTNFIAATPGSDSETNQDLANTLLIFALGINDISTPYGIGLETQRQFPSVTDYKVVYGKDSLLTRASVDAGATDIYIIGQQAAAATDTFTFGGFPLPLESQPLISIISVSSGATTYVEGTDYVVLTDIGPYGGSNLGQDSIQFLPTSLIYPAIGASIQVSYNYNAFITTLQTFFTSPKFQVDGRSLLYKQGRLQAVAVSGTLSVLPNFDTATVLANVQSAIINYIGTPSGPVLGLGVPLEQFNLLTYIGTVVGSVGGVDNFVLTVLNLVGLTGVLSSIPTSEAQYNTTTSDDVNISLG